MASGMFVWRGNLPASGAARGENGVKAVADGKGWDGAYPAYRACELCILPQDFTLERGRELWMSSAVRWLDGGVWVQMGRLTTG